MRRLLLLMMALAGMLHALPISAQTSPKNDRPWVCAYYLATNQDNGRLPPDKIDFSAITHLIHFGIIPNADGNIDPEKSGITTNQSKTIVTLAHTAGCKVLVSLGGEGSDVRLRQALTDAARPTFVQNLVRFVVERGYDGLDIDMEPLQDSDVVNYEKFIHELRAHLLDANPHLLLTAAAEPAMFARMNTEFDQINLMTYDLSGPWPGFVTWYNAALSDGGQRFPTENQPLPSVQGMVKQFVQAGVPKAKLGIGVAFFGYVWSGVTGPQQSIQGVSVDDSVDYNVIVEKFYPRGTYHWDARAHAPYLSLDSPQVKERKFISYDDERLCQEKVAYVRREGLGGLIIWELSAGYCSKQPENRRDALLQSVKRARKGNETE